MCDLLDKYNLYKIAFDIQNNRLNFGGILDLKIKCSVCDKVIKITGAASHSVVHESIYEDKLNFLKQHFNAYEFSIVTNEKIIFNSKVFNKYIVVNNAEEFNIVRCYIYNFEKYYHKCPVCGKYFISKTLTCSKVCGSEHSRETISSYFKNPENQEKIEIRNKKIGEKSAIYNKNRETPVWNKGLTGNEYLKHYEKEDGTNSLYEGLKINHGFFSKSSIELKLESIFIKLGLRFKNSWFCKNRQFDFLISFEKFVLIVEADGDYWHRSSRIFKDKEKRDEKRKEDNEKDSIILSLKKSKKPFYIIRIWEYDINNKLDILEEYFKLFMVSTDIEMIVSEFKQIYNEFS